MSIAFLNSPAAENIQAIITERGLKQVAVAQKAGLTEQAFSEMLNGKRIIKINNLAKLAFALNVEPNDLLKDCAGS